MLMGCLSDFVSAHIMVPHGGMVPGGNIMVYSFCVKSLSQLRAWLEPLSGNGGRTDILCLELEIRKVFPNDAVKLSSFMAVTGRVTNAG